MEPLQIVLVVLALAGVWALIELALVLRRARGTVDALDKTVAELNGTLEEARRVVAKLDGVVDELQPAISQVEPLLKQADIAVEALSADLVEVNGVLRDVSQVTGAAGAASGAVSGIADAASEKVQKLFGRARRADKPDATDRALEDAAPVETPVDEAAGASEEPLQGTETAVPDDAARQYYTYVPSEESSYE